jgi:hypothetical protein
MKKRLRWNPSEATGETSGENSKARIVRKSNSTPDSEVVLEVRLGFV